MEVLELSMKTGEARASPASPLLTALFEHIYLLLLQIANLGDNARPLLVTKIGTAGPFLVSQKWSGWTSFYPDHFSVTAQSISWHCY